MTAYLEQLDRDELKTQIKHILCAVGRGGLKLLRSLFHIAKVVLPILFKALALYFALGFAIAFAFIKGFAWAYNWERVSNGHLPLYWGW